MTDWSGSDASHGPPRRQRDRYELARDVMLALLASGAYTSAAVGKRAFEIADAFISAETAEPAAETEVAP